MGSDSNELRYEPGSGEFDHDAFERGLKELVAKAQEADIDVRGGYDITVSSVAERTNYTVEIYELAKHSVRFDPSTERSE